MNQFEIRLALIKAGMTQRAAARALGISDVSMWRKLTGRTEFKQSELRKLDEILHAKEG